MGEGRLRKTGPGLSTKGQTDRKGETLEAIDKAERQKIIH